MTKDQQKEKFIELRIGGETFDNIAKELEVSKQTLINWSKEDNVKETITTGKCIKYQSILKVYEQNREAKVDFFCKLIQNAKKELLNRDLIKLQTDKLYKLILDSENRLKELTPSQTIGTDIFAFDMEKDSTYIFDPED